MRAHLHTFAYRYIRPLPPLPRLAYRGATEGPGPPSNVGSSEERPCPDLGLCAPPSAPAGAAVGGWASSPPDSCTCRVKPRLKSPPPPRAGRHARGAADGLPRVLPCHPRVALLRTCACSRRGEGCVEGLWRGGGGSRTNPPSSYGL